MDENLSDDEVNVAVNSSAFTPVVKSKTPKSFQTPKSPGGTMNILNEIMALRSNMEAMLNEEPTTAKKRRAQEFDDVSSTQAQQLRDALETIDAQSERISSLESEASKYKSELSKLRNFNLELETKYTNLSATQIETESELNEISSLYKKEIAKNEELSSHVRIAEERTKSLKEDMAEKHKEFAQEKEALIEAVRSAENERDRIQDELLTAKDDIETLKHQLERARSLNESKDVQLEQQTNLLQEELERYKELLQGNTRENKSVDELNLQIVEKDTIISRLESEIQQLRDLQTLNNNLKSELDYYKSHEPTVRKALKELDMLREMQINSELLKEQIADLQNQLQRAEQRQLKYNELDLQNEQRSHNDNQEKWDDVASELGGKSPREFLLELAELRMEKEVLLERDGRFSAEESRLKAALHDAEQEMLNLKGEIASLQVKVEELKESLLKNEQWTAIITKERDSVKQLLDTFNMEDNMNVDHDQSKSLRISELEKTMLEKEQQLLQFKKDNEVAHVQLTTLSQEKIRLEKEVEQLLKEVAVLESRVGKGEFNPFTTKVLHMSYNPSSIVAQQQKEIPSSGDAEKLTSENENLKNQLNELQQRISMMSQQELMLQEIEKLQKQLQDAEKKTLRLKEAAQKKIQEFREMVYLLTGYKIEVNVNQYLLKPMYGDASDIILFQRSSKGQLDLLETEFTKKLSNEIHTFLSKCNSIPAFLSNVIIDLFQRRTFA